MTTTKRERKYRSAKELDQIQKDLMIDTNWMYGSKGTHDKPSMEDRPSQVLGRLKRKKQESK